MAKRFICTPTEPVVTTTQGKLRGFKLDNVYCFYGVPYAQAARFEAPVPVPCWEGVRDALSYGYVCPLLEQDVPNKEQLVPHRFWPMDENCLNLNVWTTSLEPDAKKPVMVWFHGGGYTAGSAIEHVAYEGDHLCEYGDVVVVSVNHRLNVLGYMDMSAHGPQFKNSANAGNADLVASLQWVHDNIAQFGGDPENVTIFGQSGGGEKVIALMNTPAADGLFHKGIIQSGVTDMNTAQEEDRRLSDRMLEILDMTAEQAQKVPYSVLAKAYLDAAKDLADTIQYVGSWPVANDWFKGNPRDVGFTEHARTIPLLVGTVMGEFDFEPGVQNKYAMTEEDTMPLLEKKYGAHTEKLVKLFREAYPGKHLSDLLYVDTFFRQPTRQFIAKRVEQHCADTYVYMMTYDMPIDGGKVAWHCSDIPFAFHNTDRTPLFNVPGETDRLQERICGAFVNFARYGSPQVSSLPQWLPTAENDETVMILDNVCQLRHNFDAALLEALDETQTAPKMTVKSMLVPDENAPLVVH
ncbi:carboxylesterase family protein [bacterium]|nr:carboxylesterase family protein [bacterium]